ncbi:hypothetical protein GCM10027053_09030 [Intrasporangium mesophilum]
MYGHRHTRHESGWDPKWGGGGWGGGGWDPKWGGGWGGGWQGGGRGRPGPPPWVQDIVRHFGGPAFGPEFNRRGPRARRGDVRAAILDVLAGDEMNGYQLIQQISERTKGAWKPSPGSVYPTVQQLEDEGLVEGRDVEGRRMLRLTDAGRRYVEENAEEMAATWRAFDEADEGGDGPWANATRPDDSSESNPMPIVGQVMSAMWQIVTTGTSQQRAEATEILTETRRKLYRLLAEGDPE